MNPLALLATIPSRVWEYAAVAAACFLIAAGFIHHERQVGAARAQAQLQHERAAVAQAGASAAAAAASETARREAAISEVVHATAVAATQVVSDADAARRERDAARVQLDAYVRARAVPASAPASGPGPAAEGPDVLLAALLNASWERNLRLAREADKRGVAGDACEQSYDALSP